MNEVKIPISAIAEIQYCPRNFYYRVMEQAEDYNHHILEGKYQEDKRKETLKTTRNEISKYRNLYLASEQHPIVGIIDEIEETEEGFYPVEYKKGSKKESVRDEIQICCQAMLIEENMDTTVEKGYLYYVESKYKKEVVFNNELRELTLDTIELAKSIIEDQVIPEVVNDNRCLGCSLVERCLPQEVSQMKNNITTNATVRPMPSLNLGRTLYVDTMGASLKKRGGLILVTKEGETLNEIPITAIDQVILMGPISVSTQLLQELLKRNIPVHLNNSYGKALGWLNPVYNKNSLLRLAQAKATLNNSLCIEIAKAVVIGKLLNQKTLLLRYNRNIKSSEVEKVTTDIKDIISKVETCVDKDQLMGYEGVASRKYFSVFNHLIRFN